MLTTVIRSDKSIENGIHMSHADAVRLTRTAEYTAILDLSESPNGFHVIYQDGVARLYDPVENVIIGKHDEHDAHLGWRG